MKNDRVLLQERWELAVTRIRQIAESPEVSGEFGEYFRSAANFLLLMLEAWEKAGRRWMESASLEELETWNLRLYEDLLGENYKKSYANPAFAAEKLGPGYGKIFSFVSAELRGMIVYAYEQRTEEMLICMELFLQLHAEFEGSEIPEADRLRDDVYWFVSDYSEITVAGRVREQIDPELSFARDIIMESDLSDPRYLYRFGEYISDTERKMSKFLAGLPQEEIDRIASVFTEGYRLGFLAAGKPLNKKKTVNIRYSVGFERIIRQAVKNFRDMGLESIIYRAAVSRVNMREANKIGYYSSSPNRQYDYDHKGDAALFLDKAFAERKLGVLRTGQPRVGPEQRLGSGLGLLQHPHIPRQIGNTQLGQAVLPGAEKVAGSPEAQVLLRDFKPIIGF